MTHISVDLILGGDSNIGVHLDDLGELIVVVGEDTCIGVDFGDLIVGGDSDIGVEQIFALLGVLLEFGDFIRFGDWKSTLGESTFALHFFLFFCGLGLIGLLSSFTSGESDFALQFFLFFFVIW